MILDCILQHIQKTNPEMTMDKLIKELKKSSSSALAIAFISKNNENKKTAY